MKEFLKFIGTTLLSTVFVCAIGIGHAVFEAKQYEKNAPPTIEQHMKNVVAITTDEEYCSGWVLKGSHQVITAAHCAPADDTSVLNVDFGDGKRHPFHVEHKYDSDSVAAPDLMTLTTSDPTVHWPAGEAVCAFKPYYGEGLTLFGGPLGFNWTATVGMVSNPKPDFTIIEAMGMEVAPYNKKLIQYQGDMMEGNSGGMAVDDSTGCVMGSADVTVRFQGSWINFLVPMSELSEINK